MALQYFILDGSENATLRSTARPSYPDTAGVIAVRFDDDCNEIRSGPGSFESHLFYCIPRIRKGRQPGRALIR